MGGGDPPPGDLPARLPHKKYITFISISIKRSDYAFAWQLSSHKITNRKGDHELGVVP